MPMYRIRYSNGHTEVISASSEEHARDIAGARLRRDLKRGFPDLSDASKAKLIRDADAQTARANVSETEPGTRETGGPGSARARASNFRPR